MSHFCPVCNKKLPWWKKYTSCHGNRIGAFFECKNCGSYIRFKIIKHISNSVEILMCIIFIPLFLIGNDFMGKNPIFIQKLGLEPNYSVGLMIYGFLFLILSRSSQKHFEYKVEVIQINEAANLQRTSFYLALVFFTPILLGLFALGLYIFIKDGMALFLCMDLFIAILFIWCLKNEWSKLKKLEKKAYRN